jgi:hypothetical protein
LWTEHINVSGSANIFLNPFLAGPSALFASETPSLNPSASAYLEPDYGLDEVPAGLTNPIAFFSFNSSNLANPAVNSEGDYAQFTVQNFSNGENASTDIIANADIGDDETGWIDMGITSTNFFDEDFTITGPHDGYIFMSAPIGTEGNGDLVFATDSTGQRNAIVFAAGGLTSNATQMTIVPDTNVHVEIQTESTSPTTGAFTVAGGAGVQGNLNVLGDINAEGNQSIVGDVTIQGSITVQGGQFVTENLSSTDPLLFVGNGNETNNFDLGFITEAKQPISGSVDMTFGSYQISASTVTVYTEDHSVTIKELTSNVATLTIGSHSYSIGDKVRVESVDSTFNGDYEITGVTATKISYALADTDVAAVASGGTVTRLIDITNREFVFTDFVQFSGFGNTDVDGYRHITAVTETSMSFITNVAPVSLTTVSPAATGIRTSRSKYSGFVKDNADGKWHLFNDLELRPETSIQFYGSSGFAKPGGYDDIKVGYVESLRGINIFSNSTTRDEGVDPVHGTMVYRTDLNVQEVYTGSTWDAIDPIHPFLLMGV